MANTTSKGSVASILFTTGLISTFLVALGFIASLWIEKWALQISTQYADEMRIGAMLFWLWLVIGASIRSVEKVRKRIEGWKLILMGLSIAVVGSLIYGLFKAVFPNLVWTAEPAVISFLDWERVSFFGLVGLVLSLISVIQLRIGNKMWANILIILVIAGILILLFYFA